MAGSEKKLKLSFNSPVILGFTFLSLAGLLLGFLTKGASNTAVFSVYRSSLVNPLTYVRFFGHVLGHSGWEHYLGNMMLFLLVGPLLEEKYGSWNILVVIVITALVTGIVSFIFFPHVRLLGASGVVFALILLSSFTSIREGEIPLTFILVALLYIGQQVYQGIVLKDDVSQLTHIIGGLVGGTLGFALNRKRLKARNRGY